MTSPFPGGGPPPSPRGHESIGFVERPAVVRPTGFFDKVATARGFIPVKAPIGMDRAGSTVSEETHCRLEKSLQAYVVS